MCDKCKNKNHTGDKIPTIDFSTIELPSKITAFSKRDRNKPADYIKVEYRDTAGELIDFTGGIVSERVHRDIRQKNALKDEMRPGSILTTLKKRFEIGKQQKAITPEIRDILTMPGRWQSKGGKFLQENEQRRQAALKQVHTLAQFGTGGKILPERPKIDEAGFRKRAAAKFYTAQYIQPLIDLDSPLKKSYINTLFCATEVIQTGDKITSSYCKNRWCRVCNRIRTAHLMNGYMSEVQALNDKQMVTLSFKNVAAYWLAPALDAYSVFWKEFYEAFRAKYKRSEGFNKKVLRGIRKIECTYNAVTDEYHPHMHMLIEGKENAETVLAAWADFCERNDLIRSNKGQDIKPCDDNAVKELFKYFTKVATATGGKEKRKYKKGATVTTVTRKSTAIYIPAMDVMFNAMKGRRVYASFGITKVVEDEEKLIAETVDGMTELFAVWRWQHGYNWFNTETNAPLTAYIPSDYEQKILLKVIS